MGCLEGIHSYPELTTTPRSEQDSPLLSRVAASAAGLTRSVFAAPNHNELNESASAALSSSGKEQ